jgi:hypothetical protein
VVYATALEWKLTSILTAGRLRLNFDGDYNYHNTSDHGVCMTTTLDRFRHQPGDGTRYDFLYGSVENLGYLLIWLSADGQGAAGGKSFRWSGGFLTASYLMEKMRVNEYAACVILKFLSTQGHDVES